MSMPHSTASLTHWRLWLVLLAALLLSGCGYNTLQSQDEAVQAAWSEILNQYQRRADLVPNLVNVVQGYAAQEREVLTEVTRARAGVGSLQVTPEMLDQPEAMAQFNAAQGELTSALSRLLVVSENYPNLKSDQLFRDLNAQLEGTENRIAVARQRYIEAIRTYNSTVRQFPTVITAKIIGAKPKANFTVEDPAAIQQAPRVNFNTAPATQ